MNGEPDQKILNEIVDSARRTYLAEERTFLAWVRSGLAALAVSLAVGRLLPTLLDADAAPYRVLGMGFGLYGLLLMLYGPFRHRDVKRALEADTFAPVPNGIIWILAVGGVVLALGTIVVVFTDL